MSKAARALKLALNNSSKEEATTAFRQVFSYAEREGVRLSDLHVIREEAGPITDERERELVDKYNALLVAAKKLRDDVAAVEADRDYYKDMYNYARQNRDTDAADKLRKLKNYIKRL